MSIEIVTIIIASISLIATVLGWSITYRYQKKLLDSQLSAEKQETIMQFSIPYKLEQIKRIRDWKTEGISLYLQTNSTIDKAGLHKIKARCEAWGNKLFSEMYPISRRLDPIQERINSRQDLKRDLTLLLTQFHLLYTVRIRTDLFGTEENEVNSALAEYEFTESNLEEELIRIENGLFQ